MSEIAAANRYANALFELANEKGVLEQTTEELEVVKNVFESVPELQEILTHPRVSNKEKHELLKKGFSSCQEIVVNTLVLLTDRGRITIILPLIQAFRQFSDDALRIARATVRAVRPLTEEEKGLIADAFSKKVDNKRLTVSSETDENLIGGLIVRIGDRVYDGSVKGQLRRIEREIVAANR